MSLVPDLAVADRPAPPAKYATPRTPSLPTIGPRIAVVSRLLGAPFMPWQRQVADVAGEAHPHLPGAFHYRLVIVTVPRQAGKTTLLRAVRVDRALAKPGLGSWMTAQTGKDARKRWADLAEVVGGPTSPLRRMVKTYRSAGSERLRFPNDSFIAPFAPVPKSLHGETPELVDIDEAWAYDAAQGQALMAAIRPAQLTLPDRQLWVVSTQGTAESVFLNELLEAGRKSLDDPNTEIAYFEWSADEDLAEADPTGPQTLSFHPALGYTQRLEDLQAEYHADEANPANYRRGILNLPTVSANTVVDLAAWDALAIEDRPAVPWDRAVVGYAVANGRTGASVWAAWTDQDDPARVVLRFLATAPGASWLPEQLAQLRAKGARVLAADDAGATRTVTTSSAMAGLDVTALGARDYATACGEFLGRVAEGTLSHDDAPELREALEAAELRPMAGGVGFDETRSRGPIDALRAAVVAAYLADRETGPQLF